MNILIIVVVALGIILILWRIFSKRWSLPCPAWLGWMVEMENPFVKVCHADTIIADNTICKGMTVLDAGCGPGRVTIPVAKQVGEEGRVVAMDIQAAMLNKVRKKAQVENLGNIECLEGGLGDGILRQNYFDRAVLVTVLGEIPDRERALKEIFGSLKVGGLLAVTEIIFDPHFLRQKVVKELAESVGFGVCKVSGGSLAYTMILEKCNATTI